MLGSKALIIPLAKMSGQLEYGLLNDREQRDSNNSLLGFFNYLLVNSAKYPAGLEINLQRFKTDLDQGLYLNSNIPQGYGTGSSGALVASVFSAYATNPAFYRENNELLRLKKYFSFMESYFHGTSSGLDPLSCFIGKPLLFSSPEKIEIVHFPGLNENKHFKIFLLDTEVTSKTGDLVSRFMKKSSTEAFGKILDQQLIPRNNKCIDLILNGETNKFFDEMRMLSRLQLEHFAEMIPDHFKPLWENGISTDKYLLKLCGSGGGGFILGFTLDYKNAEAYFLQQGKKLFLR
jgi:mevalonate kinase